MKITPECLNRKWSEVDYYDGGYLRIEGEHLLDWYIGYKDINQKSLLMVTDIDAGKLPSSKSIATTQGRRVADEKWTMTLDLLRNEQEGVFSILCSDIIQYSQTASDEAGAIELVRKRYKQWNRLLEHQNVALLSDNMIKGLIGELLFLASELENREDAISTVKGWVGPEGADQDFVYSDKWCEVKAVGISADKVTISSIEQLDNDSYGELIIMRVDKCAPEKSESFSLNELVRRIYAQVDKNSDAKELLEQKLISIGYIDLPEYETQRYYYSGIECYSTGAGFPKLTRSSLPIGVESVQYEIGISSISTWAK